QHKNNLERLAKLNNVHAVGYITQKDAPAYVAYFDVFLIPYRNSLYNTSSFPLKFWEFMATGKPIIVSGLPELHKYQPLINYAYNAGQFIEYIQSALKDPHVYEDKRIALAKQHTLEKRYQKILELVSTLFLLNIFIFLSLEHVH
ncbi:MAG: glycosyltransferase, partial [Candidatus Andersenbacteria bacterium]